MRHYIRSILASLLILIPPVDLRRPLKDTEDFYNPISLPGFRAQLNLFRRDLDPTGRMANENFYAQPDHTPLKVEAKLQWTPIEVFSFAFKCDCFMFPWNSAIILN